MPVSFWENTQDRISGSHIRISNCEFAHHISLRQPTAAVHAESLCGRMSEAERQGEGLFESLLMDTFRVSLKERIDTKRGKNLYRVSDDGSPVLVSCKNLIPSNLL